MGESFEDAFIAFMKGLKNNGSETKNLNSARRAIYAARFGKRWERERVKEEILLYRTALTRIKHKAPDMAQIVNEALERFG